MHASRLHVIAVISNPERFKSRPMLYHRFAKRMHDAGVNLITVEAAIGDRDHEVTQAGRADHVQLRTFDTLWHKENMGNIGATRLPSDAEYIAFIDADVQFARLDWAAETVHRLQHHHVVQLWGEALDLDPSFNTIQKHVGFVRCAHERRPWERKARYGEVWWHPGFAWAMTREAFDMLGGLFDHGILGAGDRAMACSLYGRAELSFPAGLHPNYTASLLRWQERAKALHQDVGYVPGTILHDWHGKKKNRGYQDRWQILVKHQFDPIEDLYRDSHGLYQLRNHRIELRDDIRAYFTSRNEDGIDL